MDTSGQKNQGYTCFYLRASFSKALHKTSCFAMKIILLFYYLVLMENTYSVYIESLNETWQMPDELAVKLIEFQKNYPEDDDNKEVIQRNWFDNLSAEEQAMVEKHKQ
jgi:hypothetical protein